MRRQLHVRVSFCLRTMLSFLSFLDSRQKLPGKQRDASGINGQMTQDKILQSLKFLFI